MEEAVIDINHMRQLHKEMDEAVLRAYQWDDMDLSHDFYEVDYLPENDRVRYTISPEARKEVLKRLLLLNHEIYNEEVKQGLHGKKKGKKKTTPKPKKKENKKQVSMALAPKPKVVSDNSDGFQVGQDVMHPKFGHGIIMEIEGSGDSEKLKIVFGGGVEKKLVAKYAGLRRI